MSFSFVVWSEAVYVFLWLSPDGADPDLQWSASADPHSSPGCSGTSALDAALIPVLKVNGIIDR